MGRVLGLIYMALAATVVALPIIVVSAAALKNVLRKIPIFT